MPPAQPIIDPNRADPVPLSALKEHKGGELAGWSLFAAGANLQSLHFVPQKAFDYIMDEMWPAGGGTGGL